MTQISNIGKIGENLASDFLIKKGFEILGKNYKQKWGEIDIIARSKDMVIIFIEVKTLMIGEYGLLKPEDNFTQQKLNKVNRAAEVFVGRHPELINDDVGWRIDLIAIEISQSGRSLIRHYENV
jgi:putative endonuclease